MGHDTDHGRPSTEFCTTYRRVTILRISHECGKSIDVPDGMVTDDLCRTHRCGPVGSPWDSHIVGPPPPTQTDQDIADLDRAREVVNRLGPRDLAKLPELFHAFDQLRASTGQLAWDVTTGHRS